MRLFKFIVATFLLLASINNVNGQISSENLVGIHTLNTTQITGLSSPIQGSLVFNTDSNKLFVFDGTSWIATATVDTTNLSNRINQRVRYSDTATMLSPYLRSALGVKYSDTSSMLLNYINTASNGLTKSGKDVRLGGSLSSATSIATTSTNTLALSGLQSGSSNDSIVVANASTGVLRRVSFVRLSNADSTTASNGITLSGKDVRLGGNLTAATTITNNSNALTFATGGTAINITGLTSGVLNDSLVSINPSTGRLNRVSPNILNKTDSTTASNGITLSGKDVRLGGALTGATSITTTAANTLAVSGLQSGSTNDSILVSDPSSGTLKRVSANRLATGWTLTGNSGTTPGTNFIGTTDGVDLVFKVNNVESGRLNLYNLSAAYGYNSVAGYKSTAMGYGASTGSNTESVTIGNASSSVYRAVAVGSEAVTTGNNSIALGQASTAAFQGTALGSTASATGNNSTAIGFGATTSQANALILGNSSAQVGIGTSTPGYALDVNATFNPLKLSGLVSGAITDSLMTINTTGVVRRIAPSQLNKADSTTASNGITLTGKDVRLGGNLTAATTITNNSNALTIATGGSALNVTGLTAGASTDSLLTINTMTGRVNRVAPSILNKVDSTTASNGITLTGKDVRLGGALTASTTITTDATNTLLLAGLQSGSLNDSVVMITSGNVLRRINSTSLALEPFNVLGGSTKASTNTQNIYTQGDLSVGKSLSTATLDVGGKIKADSTVTAPNFTTTVKAFGSTGGAVAWDMQTGGATATITLTSNATVTISNATAGMYGLIRVTQDGTGGRTITFAGGTIHKVINGGSSTFSLTQTAGATDILSFFYDGSNYWWTIGNNYN